MLAVSVCGWRGRFRVEECRKSSASRGRRDKVDASFLPNPLRNRYGLKGLAASAGSSWSGALLALIGGMDYEKMKAMMEANREEAAVERESKIKEFPAPDSQPDWKSYVAEEKAA